MNRIWRKEAEEIEEIRRGMSLEKQASEIARRYKMMDEESREIYFFSFFKITNLMEEGGRKT